MSTLPVFADSLFVDHFNRIDRFFSQLTGDTPVGALPAYDLQKIDDSDFLLSVSVPSRKDEELEIETVGGNLHITGKREKTDSEAGGSQRWIYKGIRHADFQLDFSLPEHAQINQAQLGNGVLKMTIHQEIPESGKPRKIVIENHGRVIEHKVRFGDNSDEYSLRPTQRAFISPPELTRSVYCRRERSICYSFSWRDAAVILLVFCEESG